jgi:hypothetical protein
VRGLIRVAVVLAALAIVVVAPANASASSGEITKASVSPGWLQGSFGGTVTWSGCARAGPKTVACTGRPYAAVAAGGSLEACGSPDRELVWEGQQQGGAGAQSFEVVDFPLDGSGGKVLCLGLIEEDTTEIPCVPPGEPIPPGWHCPYKTTSTDSFLVADVLKAEAAPKPEPPVHRRCHRARHRRHRICLSQHQKVPEA